MKTSQDMNVSHQLKAAKQNAKLVVFIGPPKTGTTSIIASLGTKENRATLRSKNIFFQEIEKSELTYNELAKKICQDPTLLTLEYVSRQASTSLMAAEAFWGCIRDQSLFRFLEHCRSSFNAVEVVFVKRQVEDLAISQFLQSCKVLLRSNATGSVSKYDGPERYKFTESKVVNFLLGRGSIIRPYDSNYLSLSQSGFPVSYINYSKSRDIVSEFFTRVLDCELQDQSMTKMNRSSSSEDAIQDYLTHKIGALLQSEADSLSPARKAVLEGALQLLPTNLKRAIRRLGGAKFRNQAAEIESQFREIFPTAKRL